MVTPQTWPDWLDDLWAKSAGRGESGEAETLARHTWLVISRLADFMRLRPSLPQQLGQPRLWHCLYWGALLHDFGKAMPGFQGVLRDDRALRERWGGHRHEVFSLAFLDWIADGLTDEERLWTAAAIVSHHRDASDLRDLYPTPEPDEPDPLLAHFEGLLDAHVSGLHRWLIECGWAWAQALELDALGVTPVGIIETPAAPFAGYAVQIRKWLRAYSNFVRQLSQQIDLQLFVPLIALRGTLVNADHSASAHAPDLPSVRFSSQDVLTSRNIQSADLFEHQTQAGRIRVVLLTAPTGSGKTEAALLWAAQQTQGMDCKPRLFYTLPYQASMNAMQTRLKAAFGPEQVGLQHGRSLLALYQQLMERDYGRQQARQEAARIRDLVKLNYPPVRVFSPYQMLKGAYRLKGYEAQLTDYHNGLFIFDEIHAYEVKRLALILKTIEYLRRYYHTRFFIMSATFPSLIKAWLRQALGESQEITAAPELFDRFQRHILQLTQGDLLEPGHFDRIAKQARSGKSVLVVCNLVDRAQMAHSELANRLQGDAIPVILLHGRFNLRDRLTKESAVEESSGAKSQTRHPVVLVATQVVEVSLDIDLDTIYTDPAPLEALVQRFGRINRRGSLKELAPVNVFTQPDDGQGIYDERLVSRTLKVLDRQKGQPIRESSIGDWLDEIYEGEVATEWQAEFEKTAREFESVVINTLRPFQADRSLRQKFYEAFDGVEVLPAIYWDEYEALLQEAPLEARQLLVSISYGRLHQLRSKRCVLTEKDAWPIVVDAPYSSELGLDFSAL